MGDWGFLRWLNQTPARALLAAVTLIVFLVGLAETATGFLNFPGWIIQATGVCLFAAFLLLVTYQHQQAMDARMDALEDHAHAFREKQLAQLEERIPKLVAQANDALTGDDYAEIIAVRPEIASTMMSLQRDFGLKLDLTSTGDPRRYVLLASSFLFNVWPFIRDNHMWRAENGVEKYNTFLADYLDENGQITAEKKAS